MSEPIEVHVLGAKIGESIVVRLPGDIWGVVDNYTPTLRNPESNPTLKFLQERGVKQLSFLCLTHPHEDHYRGMSHLLKVFRPDHVWLFGAMTHRDLYAKVAEVLKEAAESRNIVGDDAENADELVRILDRVRDEYEDKQRSPRLSVKRLQLGMTLLDLDCDPPLRVSSIGASGGRALLYEETLSKCFKNVNDFLADRVPSVNHNMISGGLLIEFGQARIILGGDIEKAAWEETLREFSTDDRLRADLVKVSHHGSETGYCDGLWDRISPQKTAIAVITPYSSKGLPSAEGLAHISGYASVTLCASIKAASLATDWSASAVDIGFQGVSADALLTLREVFPKAPSPSDRLEGICSFFVANDGKVTHSFTGAAGKLG